MSQYVPYPNPQIHPHSNTRWAMPSIVSFLEEARGGMGALVTEVAVLWMLGGGRRDVSPVYEDGGGWAGEIVRVVRNVEVLL